MHLERAELGSQTLIACGRPATAVTAYQGLACDKTTVAKRSVILG
jgi:hypothetical protein